MKLLTTSLSVAGAAALLLAVSTAHAQSITFTESSTGAFNGGAPSANPPAFLELRYTGNSFTDSTTNGFLAVGGLGSSNLGVFTLANGTDTFNGSTFNLTLAFSQPSGTTPASIVIPATLSGSITSAGAGGVLVDFDNTAHNFTFNGGTFSLVVLDTALNAPAPGQTTITGVGGFITAVPEPSTISAAFVGMGLLVASQLYKRRRTQLA